MSVNTAVGRSAANRTLTISELLDNIFSFLGRRDAAHAAQVSKGWVEVGRDHVWRVVHTPCQLFNILSPIYHDPICGHVRTFSTFSAFDALTEPN